MICSNRIAEDGQDVGRTYGLQFFQMLFGSIEKRWLMDVCGVFIPIEVK